MADHPARVVAWQVPVRIVERKRLALVFASSASEARAKARRAEWESCGNCDDHDVSVVGAAKRDPESDDKE